MDGCPRLSLMLCLGFSILSPGLLAQVTDPPDVWLYGKVRDFKEANPIDPANTHPHFNTYNACSAQEAAAPTAEDNLDMAQPADGMAFPGDDRGPRLRTDMPATLSRCFIPMDRFSDWFADRGPDVNRAFQFDLHFKRDAATGLYVHESANFFPLDNGSPFRKFEASDPDPFGHLQTGTLDGKDLTLHNYGFTMEFHTRIVYDAGKHHRLTFQGDDDIWVFINGRKVVDLGGVHATQNTTVDMDSLAAAIGLVTGNDYPMDFYFAERHTGSSSFRITANLHIPSTAVRPFSARGRPGFATKVAAGTEVEVYDRGGRLVRSLRPQTESAMDRAWDGRDSQGRPASPGMYYWRAKTKAAAPAISGWVMNGDNRD